MVIERHSYPVEQIVTLLKGEATRALIQEGMHPFHGVSPDDRPPTPWARGEWKVFLDSEADVERAIRYVEENPVRERKPSQSWSFVVPFQGSPAFAPSRTRSSSSRG